MTWRGYQAAADSDGSSDCANAAASLLVERDGINVTDAYIGTTREALWL
jgi:hypothetical protein